MELDFADIARRFESRQATAMRSLARDAEPLAEGWMAFAGVGSYFNKACGFGQGASPTDADLDRLVHFFVSRGVEPKVELSPFVSPKLLARLAERGFVLSELENVLARRLPPDEELRVALPLGGPAGVDLEHVNLADDVAVHEYVKVAGSGFLPEGEPMPEVYFEAGLKATRMPGYDGFVARAGMEVVGAGGCESGGGLTILFGTSVKPAFRRRGIQQALIGARLRRAREQGSDLAIIVSGPGIPTERNAARLGFAMAYTRVVLVKHGDGLVPSP